jgi:hypothetical protein
MNRILRFALISLILLGHAGIVQGMECRDVSFPTTMQAAGGALKLNGLGLRQATFLKVDVYVAALYVTETSADAAEILEADSPKHLILHFVRVVPDRIRVAVNGHLSPNKLLELPPDGPGYA